MGCENFSFFSDQYYYLSHNENNEEFNKTPGLYYPELKGTLPLYGRTLDAFFHMMKEKTFPFLRKRNNQKIKGMAGCCEKCPDIEIQMEPVWGPSEEFDGIILRGELPNMVDGTEYKYFFNDKNLNRADQDKLNLHDLMRENNHSKEIRFTVGRRNLPEFYYRVLPELEEIAEISIVDGDIIESNLSPEAEFTFFLDAEDGVMSCKPVVRYGEHQNSLFGLEPVVASDENMQTPVYGVYRDISMEREVPEALQGTLRNYQEFGYKWLRTVEDYRFGGILADDMGLGKTLQMIAVLIAAKEEGRIGTALIVTPASLVYNWREEFGKFAPELSVNVVAGTKSEREAQIENAENVDVLVTSYDLLKRDILLYGEKEFSHQVIDEAQYVKNHTTAAAKSVKAINSKVRFALTGTPIENRLSELWSIILRRLKQDVLNDLPDKNEEICYVHLLDKQQKLYDGQVVHMKQMLEGQNDETFRKNKIAILAEITRIRQICCDPSLCLDNYDGESAKREACIELLKSAIDGEHKVLVFSHFRSLLELLEEDLQREGIDYYKITGETKKEERVNLVKRFNKDKNPVFLISLKAGGTGLNLTGADIVIHFDPWWNLAAQNQALTVHTELVRPRKFLSTSLLLRIQLRKKFLRCRKARVP